MNLICLNDLPKAELYSVVNRAVDLAKDPPNQQTLVDKRIGLVVEDGGWRNTTALDLGVQLLGATCVHIPASLSGKEELADLAQYFDNWFDLIGVRTPSLKLLQQLARLSKIPIVNLRTSINHPCETLGDLSFIYSKLGKFDGLSVVAVAPKANIVHSWAEAAMVLPITLTQIAPKPLWIDSSRYDAANIILTEDMAALNNADVIITDCWPEAIPVNQLLTYRIDTRVLNSTKQSCLFIPCPPVTRDREVTTDAMLHDRCVVYAAKDYLIHAQNAVVEYLLNASP